MAKLTTLVDEKINDLKSQIAAVKVSDKLTKNTRGTQLYKLGRERRVLQLIRSLITDDTKLSDADMDTLVLITTLASERTARTSVECAAGDKILDLMQKYDGLKYLSEKLNKYCEANGLKLDYAKGVVVKVTPTKA